LSTALSLARVGWRVSLYEKAKVLEESGQGSNFAERQRHSAKPRRARAPDAFALCRKRSESARTGWRDPCAHASRKCGKALGGALSCRSSRRSAAGAFGNGRARRQHHTSDRSRRRGLCPQQRWRRGAIAQGAVRLKVAGDCLIGADGLRSYVRQRLHADALRFSGAPPGARRSRPLACPLPCAERKPTFGSGARRILSIIPCAAAPSSMSSRSWTRISTLMKKNFGRAPRAGISRSAFCALGQNREGFAPRRSRVAEMAASGSQSSRKLCRGPRRADGRCGASHAALPGPGRGPGDRRCGRFGGGFGTRPNDRSWSSCVSGEAAATGGSRSKRITPASYDLSSRRSGRFSAGCRMRALGLKKCSPLRLALRCAPCKSHQF